MRNLRVGAIMGVGIALFACSTMRELPVPPERLVQRGYSLLPPAETGWVLAGRGAERLYLVRRGARPDESFAIVGAFVKLPALLGPGELVPIVRDQNAADMSSERYKVLTHEVSPLKHFGVQCARTYLLAEDRAPVRQSSRTDPLILELLSVTCVHPGESKIGVSVGYSHRTYPDERDAAFQSRGDKLIQSLEFIDVVQVRNPAVYCMVSGQPLWVYDRARCD